MQKTIGTSIILLATISLMACGGSSSDASPDILTPTPDTATPDTATPPTPDTTTPPTPDTTTPPTPDTATPPTPDTATPPQGDGTDSFEEAITVEFDAQAPTLESLNPTGDEDFFKFVGTKGQGVLVFLQAQNPAFDKDSIDTVITLYDENKNKIAANDDPFPRDTNDSSLFTLLPADGTYYLLVEECWTWITKKGLLAGCAEPKEKTVTDYALYLRNVDSASAGNILDAETGNTAADATPITYNKNQSGAYYLSLVYGLFADNLDVDVFSFALPEDTTVSNGRSVAYFSIYPAGVDGNGSTSPVGNVYITSAADTASKVAWINGVDGGSLNVPLPLGEDYLLFVEHPGGVAGTNDFYAMNHNGGGSNPVEAEEEANNEAAGAEALTISANSDGSSSYFIEGNLGVDDVDIFKFDVPASMKDRISIACGAQRSGSGLRGFKAELLDDVGAAIAGGMGTETGTTDLLVQNVPVPDVALLHVKLTAASQATDVTSDFYRCGLHFMAAQ